MVLSLLSIVANVLVMALGVWFVLFRKRNKENEHGAAQQQQEGQQQDPPRRERQTSNGNSNSSRNNQRRVAATAASTSRTNLNATVLASFYQRNKGGAVVSFGQRLMLAVEFMGPTSSRRGAEVEMVFTDNNNSRNTAATRSLLNSRRLSRATQLGTAFLDGEDVEYLEARTEEEFKALLSRYKRGARTQHMIDVKSGLKIYETVISP